MTDSEETGTLPAPKGNAQTLRQKDRVTTKLCRVGLPTPKVQPDHSGNLSGYYAEAQNAKRAFCAFFHFIKE